MSNKTTQDLWRFVKRNASVISTIVVIIGGFSYLENRLNGLDSRLSKVEGQLDVLRDVVVPRAVTQTVTTTISGFALPIGPPVAIYAIMALVVGIALWAIFRLIGQSIEQHVRDRMAQEKKAT